MCTAVVRTLSLWLGVGVLLVTSLAFAREAMVPAKLQGAIFAKALQYDQVIGDKPKKVIVLKGSSREHTDSVAEAFRAAQVPIEILTEAQAAERLEGASAIYSPDGELSGALRGACVRHQVLTLSGHADAADDGHVALALEVHEERPRLVVHLGRVRAEGHRFSSELLRLARVIR